MTHQHDTFDRRIQLGASRRRREDAEALHQAQRWSGAMYLSGYAVECSLKSLICFYERKDNFKETRLFKRGVQGASLHSLIHLLQALPHLQRDIRLDRTEKLKEAWNTITRLWQKDELRYWNKMGDEGDSQQLLEAVKVIHRYILNQQGEAL